MKKFIVVTKHQQSVDFSKTRKVFSPEEVEQTFSFLTLGDALEFVSAINTELPLTEIRLYSTNY
jgi:hypothetical protein